MENVDFKAVFDLIKLNEVKISYKTAESKVPLGHSKFGGKPHLPKDFKWFYYEGVSYDSEIANRPLSFLAQINLSEVHEYDTDSRLPASGILYFFYEMVSMTWGYNPADKGSARVYYYNGELSGLTETDFPDDLSPEYVVPEMELSFETAISLPSFEEFDRFGDNSIDWDDYSDAADKYVGYRFYDDSNCSKLLGYADLVQGEMLTECERVSRGFYCGGGDIDITPEESVDIDVHSSDWVLLFQMGTVEAADDYELMWGDCGNLYFYIKKQDLIKHDFNNIWLVLQCS